MPYDLAQANVSYCLTPRDDPRLASFIALLAEINQLAERSPGFVWRFISDTENPEHDQYEDDRVLFNMTVWESMEALHAFTYRTAHARVFARRKEWFAEWKEAVGGSSFALWYLPAGCLPSAEEGKARLETIKRLGPTPEAFTFKKAFPPPDSAA